MRTRFLNNIPPGWKTEVGILGRDHGLRCTALENVSSGDRNVAYGHPFLNATPEIGWYALGPVLLGPVLEELLFRGVLFRWFERAGFGVWGNAIVGSVLFVLWHYTQLEPLRMLVLFATGLLLFHLRHRSGSILLAIVVHGFVNLLAHVF